LRGVSMKIVAIKFRVNRFKKTKYKSNKSFPETCSLKINEGVFALRETCINYSV
jgi:hypothetical protein